MRVLKGAVEFAVSGEEDNLKYSLLTSVSLEWVISSDCFMACPLAQSALIINFTVLL